MPMKIKSFDYGKGEYQLLSNYGEPVDYAIELQDSKGFTFGVDVYLKSGEKIRYLNVTYIRYAPIPDEEIKIDPGFKEYSETVQL
jgi:hypothetical protein